MQPIDHVAVYGAGAWGTALANAAARAGRRVTLIGRDAAAMEATESTRGNPRLPGVMLESKVAATADLSALGGAQALLLVVPAQSLRAALVALRDRLPPALPVIACAKGIERGSKKFVTEIVADELPAAIPAILSGPSFAADVARGLPTAVTLAAADAALARDLAQALASATFRPYHTTDIRGVEIGGAAKNVLAIAAGIVAGRKLGASALAALTTRGFAELARFGRACGARAETLGGLSGLGDLILTCSGPQSRNFALGLEIGEAGPQARPAQAYLAEGAYTASVLAEIASEKNVDMPIAQAVGAILAGRLTVDAAIDALLNRPLKAEE